MRGTLNPKLTTPSFRGSGDGRLCTLLADARAMKMSMSRIFGSRRAKVSFLRLEVASDVSSQELKGFIQTLSKELKRKTLKLGNLDEAISGPWKATLGVSSRSFGRSEVQATSKTLALLACFSRGTSSFCFPLEWLRIYAH